MESNFFTQINYFAYSGDWADNFVDECEWSCRRVLTRVASDPKQGRAMRPLPIELLEARRLLAVIYVDRSAPNGTNIVTSWTHAFRRLQDALPSASDGDEIRVADGSYQPTGINDKSFDIEADIKLLGGYAGYGAPNPNARNADSHVTTLTRSINAQSGYYNLGISEENAEVTIDGFRISTHLVIDGISVNVVISNCRFLNTSQSDIFASSQAGRVRISDSTFSGSAGAERAISGQETTAFIIENCTFSNYEGASDVVSVQAISRISDCVFTDNSTRSLNINVGEVFRCAFADNISSTDGTIKVSVGERVDINYCTFDNNHANVSGGAIYVQGLGTVSKHNPKISLDHRQM